MESIRAQFATRSDDSEMPDFHDTCVLLKTVPIGSNYMLRYNVEQQIQASPLSLTLGKTS